MDTRKLNGKFKGRAVDGGLGETSTGKEQVAILFELSGEETKGVRLTYYGYFTEGAVETTVKGLRACGWQGTDLTELLDFKKSHLGDNEVELVIEPERVQDAQKQDVLDEKGNPQVRARIRWINPLGRIGLKEPLAADKAAAFAARMKGALLAIDQKSGSPKANGSAQGSRPTPPPPATDPGDAPF